jgi:hypothetical protein
VYKIRIQLFVLNLREIEVFVCYVRRIVIELLLARVAMDNDNRVTVVCLCNKLCVCVISYEVDRGCRCVICVIHVDASQKETAIDQQQNNCETLICQRHQTILRILPSAAMASTR